MKSLTKLSLAFVSCLAAAPAVQGAPFVSLGDSLDLYINSEAGARYESNVTLAPDNEEEDVVLIFSPGLELVAGRPGRTEFSGRILYRHEFLVYADLDDLDADNANVNANANYNTGRFNFNTSISYIETQTNTGIFSGTATSVEAGRIDRAHFSWNNYGEYEISRKTSVGAGLNFGSTDYDATGYYDYSSATIPVDVYFAMTPKMDLSLGYRYRQVEVDTTSDYTDNFFNVGVRGEIAPKLDGSFRIGYQQRDPEAAGADDDDSISFEGAVIYAASPLATVRVSLMRDYGISGVSGGSIVRTGGTIAGTYELSPLMKGTARFGYYNSDYTAETIGGAGTPTREDDYYNFGLSLSYTPNEYLQLSGGYVYYSNESNRNTIDFGNNVIEFTALFRY